jgi:negative regulator of flagellin synthesis FlgM
MKIGPSSTDGLRADGKPVVNERAVPVRGGSPSDPVGKVQSVERVSLSGAAPTLFGAAAAPTFDDKKVEEVRRAIAEGRFPVDARRVADVLLAEARDMLGVAPSTRPAAR